MHNFVSVWIGYPRLKADTVLTSSAALAGCKGLLPQGEAFQQVFRNTPTSN